MVFESVLADVLNRFLKPYVKKLDTSQLKLGIWGGNAHTLMTLHIYIHTYIYISFTGNVSLGKLELKEDLFVSIILSYQFTYYCFICRMSWTYHSR